MRAASIIGTCTAIGAVAVGLYMLRRQAQLGMPWTYETPRDPTRRVAFAAREQAAVGFSDMTPKQKQVVDFICDGVKAKGYTCEVTPPRDAHEAARIRTSSKTAYDRIGVGADGYPLLVEMSQTTDRPYNALVRRLLGKAKKLK